MNKIKFHKIMYAVNWSIMTACAILGIYAYRVDNPLALMLCILGVIYAEFAVQGCDIELLRLELKKE